MHMNKKAQFITEYIIVIGIALSIIAVFLVYVLVYYSGYSNSSNSNQISTITNSIVQEANYVFSEGVGSKTSFTLGFPDLQVINSFFCGDYIKVTSSQYSSVSRADEELEGLLPLKQGTYVMYARYNQTGIVQIGLDSGVSYINYTYSYDSSKDLLFYNLTFFDSQYLISSGVAGIVPYNITVFSVNGVYLNSSTSLSVDDFAYGELTLKPTPSEAIIDIFVNGAVAPSCFYP